MSTILDLVTAKTRAAALRRRKALASKGVRRANDALRHGMQILAREGLGTFPEAGEEGLIRITPEWAEILGLEAE